MGIGGGGAVMDERQAFSILWDTLHAARESLPDGAFPDSAWDQVCEAMDALAIAAGYEGGTIDWLNNGGTK